MNTCYSRPRIMVHMFDGKKLADAIRAKIKDRVAAMPQAPGLAVLLVGDDPASHLYVRLKQKACEESGIRFEKFLFSAETDERILIDTIKELNAREDVDGILVQLPLPAQDADCVVGAIHPRKDVDGFHPENVRALKVGKPCLAPPVHLSVMKLIEASGQNVNGLRAIIVSRSLFAEPLVVLLKERGVTAEIISPDADEVCAQTRSADIVVVAVGRPHFLMGTHVKPGAIIIDIGTTKVNGTIVGDADRASVDTVAGWVSPVPGGVGPLTVAYLLLNILKAKQIQIS